MTTRPLLLASALLYLACGSANDSRPEPAGSSGDETVEAADPTESAPRSMSEAIAAAYVGEEFWTVRGGLDEAIDEETGDPGYLVTRHCGDAAREAAAALGAEEWSCSSDTYCERPEMCGNHCEGVSGQVDPGTGAVTLIAHFDGMEGGGGVPIAPDQLDGWAATTPCGETTRLALDAL